MSAAASNVLRFEDPIIRTAAVAATSVPGGRTAAAVTAPATKTVVAICVSTSLPIRATAEVVEMYARVDTASKGNAIHRLRTCVRLSMASRMAGLRRVMRMAGLCRGTK
jgi:hypothetical protein